jgi:single-strand DNA-binding protein
MPASNSRNAPAGFSLAVEGPRKNEDGQAETLWLDAVTFNKTAEACQQYLTKGSKVLVEGKLNPPRTPKGALWAFERRDVNTGISLSLWADRVQFLDTRRREGQADGEPTAESNDETPF